MDNKVGKELFCKTFFLLSVLFSILALYGNTTPYKEQFYEPNLYSFFERIFLSCFSLILYISKFIFPFELSVYYPYPERTAGMLPLEVWLSPLFFILPLIFARRFTQHRKALWFSSTFFLFTIVVNLPILPVGQTIIADRFMYLPSVGLCFLTSYAVFELAKNQKICYGVAAGILGIVILFSITTFQRNFVWQNSWILWSDVIKKYPKTASAYYNRGNFYADIGDQTRAAADYHMAIKINPLFFSAYNNLGNMYFLAQDYDQAFAQYNKVLAINPRHIEAYSNRGMYFIIKGNYKAAVEDFDKVLAIDPGNTRIKEFREKYSRLNNKGQ